MRPLMPPVQTPDNLFHDGNPLTGELGTIVDAEHLNNVQGAVRDAQSELITVLTAAGINVDPSKQNQLLTALKALLLSRSTPFADIKSDGAAAIATALSNLGLGEGSPIIGSPLPWPHAKMPNELFPSMANMVFLKSNGANFYASQYPMLALAYPALRLPDLRSEFIRGYDDGRGVNPSQALLGWAADEFKTHNHPFRGSGGATGSNTVFGVESGIKAIYTNGINQPDGTVAPASQDPGGSETRPRSVAFNYIVRAA